MIRSKELDDKLIADLYFHNYLRVWGDNIFLEQSEDPGSLAKTLLKGSGLDASTSFVRTGTVGTDENIKYLHKYIDDVFLDYFFRTHKFEEIVFPAGCCCTRITSEGIKNADGEVRLNLNNLYDRCTFLDNMSNMHARLSILNKQFPKNKFLQNFYLSVGEKNALSYYCSSLSRIKFEDEIYLYESETGENVSRSNMRSATIKEYFDYTHEHTHGTFCRGLNQFHLLYLRDYIAGYNEIKDSHIFGNYTLEDILIIYAVLSEKLIFSEDKNLMVSLLFVIEDLDKTLFKEIRDFENTNRDYRTIQPSIVANDMYLRFASSKNSKAFKINYENDVRCSIQLFEQKPISHVIRGNSFPLPYLYDKLNY